MIHKAILALLFFNILLAQGQIGDWESYTSPLMVRDITSMGRTVYCATAGGILVFDTQSRTFETWNNLDGLTETDLSSMGLDSLGNLWVGGNIPNGIIQQFDPGRIQSQQIFDYSLTQVTNFFVTDSIIFGIFQQNQDKGLIEFKFIEGQYQYIDVYRNWPDGIQSINDVLVKDDEVWIATNQGIYRGNWKTDNLKNPQAWEKPYLSLNGIVKSIVSQGQYIWVAWGNTVYRIDLEENRWDPVYTYLDHTVQELAVAPDGKLWGRTWEHIVQFGPSSPQFFYEIQNASNFTNSLHILSNGDIMAGCDRGLFYVDPDQNSVSQYIPNAPLTNEFSAITVLRDGRIVGASKYGLTIRESDGWRNIVEERGDSIVYHYMDDDYRYFIGDTIPVDFGGFVADIEESPQEDGVVYMGIRGTYPEPYRHGGGIVRIDIDYPSDFTLIDTTYLDYFTTSSNPIPYMVVKDLEFDKNDALWVADTYSINRNRPVQVRDSEWNWGGYYADSTSVNLAQTMGTIGFDAWDRVWVGAFREGDQFTVSGLYMLSYKGSPAHPDAYAWKKIEGLIDNTIWSLGITADNRLYYLTPLGLNYLDLRENPDNPVLRKGEFTYFPNISFGDGAKLRLDSRDNIWTVSPTGGIHVLLNNTTYWPDENPELVVEGITKETSPLLSNEVTDIEFDDEAGIAYITSKRGINRLKIPFADKRPDYSNLRVFPSPYHIPARMPLIIDGLADGSSAKIMTLTGEVIRSLRHTDLGYHGYQIAWDGRTEQGDYVGSGVYLIGVYNDQKQSFEKVTVIRH